VAITAGAAALAVVIGAGTAYKLNAGGGSGAPGGTPSGPGSGQAAAAGAPPVVVFGSYKGSRPASITLHGITEGGGLVRDIHWASWTALTATGTGTLGSAPATVTLSHPVSGRFTRIGEILDGHPAIQNYPGDEWPSGAAPRDCVKPTSAALTAAWRKAPASVRQGWAAPTAGVTGFSGISCWEDWVVAAPIGNGDGTFIFSQSGGLHVMPAPDLQSFTDAVCEDPEAPKAWKDPNDGAAVCQ
jgi:hypothetical protein